jgi:hypothetical protein
VIKPDPAAVLRTVDITQIWGHPIVMEDVPLTKITPQQRVSRAAQDDFWILDQRGLIVARVVQSIYDVQTRRTTATISPVGLLAGDMNIGAKPLLRVERDGLLSNSEQLSLLMLEQGTGGFDARVGAGDYGFLPSRSEPQPQRGFPATQSSRVIAPFLLAGLDNPFLPDQLRVVQRIRRLSLADRAPTTRPLREIVAGGVHPELPLATAVTSPIKTWEGNGRPAVILGALREITQSPGSSRYAAILHPLLTLAGRFEPALFPRLPISFNLDERIKQVPAEGAIVIAVARIYDPDDYAVQAVVVTDGCPFMPDSAPLVVLSGLTDPRIMATVQRLRGH